jgi:hypothetical protein
MTSVIKLFSEKFEYLTFENLSYLSNKYFSQDEQPSDDVLPSTYPFNDNSKTNIYVLSVFLTHAKKHNNKMCLFYDDFVQCIKTFSIEDIICYIDVLSSNKTLYDKFYGLLFRYSIEHDDFSIIHELLTYVNKNINNIVGLSTRSIANCINMFFDIDNRFYDYKYIIKCLENNSDFINRMYIFIAQYYDKIYRHLKINFTYGIPQKKTATGNTDTIPVEIIELNDKMLHYYEQLVIILDNLIKKNKTSSVDAHLYSVECAFKISDNIFTNKIILNNTTAPIIKKIFDDYNDAFYRIHLAVNRDVKLPVVLSTNTIDDGSDDEEYEYDYDESNGSYEYFNCTLIKMSKPSLSSNDNFFKITEKIDADIYVSATEFNDYLTIDLNFMKKNFTEESLKIALKNIVDRSIERNLKLKFISSTKIKDKNFNAFIDSAINN